MSFYDYSAYNSYSTSRNSRQDQIWFEVPTPEDLNTDVSVYNLWNNPGTYWTAILRIYADGLPLPASSLGRFANRGYTLAIERREVLFAARREIDDMDEAFEGLEGVREELRTRIEELGGPRVDMESDEDGEFEWEEEVQVQPGPSSQGFVPPRSQRALAPYQQPVSALLPNQNLAPAPAFLPSQNPAPTPPTSTHGKVPIATVFTANGSDFLPTYRARGQIRSILNLPPQRLIPWRANVFANQKPEMERERILASAIATRGVLRLDCAKCAASGGPFNGCYTLAGYAQEGCANCEWDHHPRRCTHAP